MSAAAREGDPEVRVAGLVAMIAAMDEARLIGARGALPWHLPADLRWFRRVTMGKPIVMGRSTHESIGRALPGRRNVVVSRRRGLTIEGCTVAADLDAALVAAGDAPEIMVIGGAQLYAAALPRARRLYLTRLHGRFEGDAWFPELEASRWQTVSREDHPAGEGEPCAYSFEVLERVD